jgi:hypothetical protein
MQISHISPFAIRHSPFAIRHSPFAIRHTVEINHAHPARLAGTGAGPTHLRTPPEPLTTSPAPGFSAMNNANASCSFSVQYNGQSFSKSSVSMTVSMIDIIRL